MATEPLEEQIEVAMVAQLRTIAAGPTYAYTPSLVTRALLGVEAYEKELALGPVLGVVRDTGDLERDVHDPAGYDLHHVVGIEGYVDPRHAAPGVLANTLVNVVRSDVIRCLLTAGTFGLGPSVWRSEPIGQRETDQGIWEPRGWFRQQWMVRASWSAA